MSNSEPYFLEHRQENNQVAILFIHGFGGNAEETWGKFPTFLKDHPDLTNWDIFSLGYSSRLRIDFWANIWAADPDIAKLAQYLATFCNLPPLDRYQSLTLIAHSMGGLVVQRALANSVLLTQRISHVFLFGTPSGGLGKASVFRLIKRQFKNMSPEDDFIKNLRHDWNQQFGCLSGRRLPFKLWVTAGELDEFVPATSSLEPFPKDNFPEAILSVVPGNHIQIVKPVDTESKNIQIVIKGVRGKSNAMGAWNGAAVAVESRNFQKAITLLAPHQQELDEDALVQLALAYEGVGRSQEALAVLESRPYSYTDPLGVLAGRLKRRWLVERRESDARRARELYAEGYLKAEVAENHDQAFYHGINIAFMDLAFEPNRNRAKALAMEMANKVLVHCSLAEESRWRTATEGEAYLILMRIDESLASYETYVRKAPKPRELESTFQQAKKVADLLGNNTVAAKLDDIFTKTI